MRQSLTNVISASLVHVGYFRMDRVVMIWYDEDYSFSSLEAFTREISLEEQHVANKDIVQHHYLSLPFFS